MPSPFKASICFQHYTVFLSVQMNLLIRRQNAPKDPELTLFQLYNSNIPIETPVVNMLPTQRM